VGFNNIGVRGVAPGAQLIGLNALAKGDEASTNDAFIRGDISNGSFGPADNGMLHPSTALYKAAIEDGITNRRDGKGIVYFRAGGNGRLADPLTSDYSNYDAEVSHHGVNAIAALDDNGKQASYSESGSNILISTHAGEFCDTNTQTTVDVTGTAGANNAGKTNVGTVAAPDIVDNYVDDSYTKCFNGTSGATPVAAGVAALVLQANPNLTRRDVRLLLARTARKNDPNDGGWAVNGASMPINHKYGFGAIDAAAAVAAVSSWTLLSAQKTPDTLSSTGPAISIPDSPASGTLGTAATSILSFGASSISQVEFVEVTVTSDHTFWFDLEITLTSPAGTKSVLAQPHFTVANPTAPDLTGGFTFGSVRHTDEVATGDWMLSVRDADPGSSGNITSWSIKIYGR
jgi:proprotein convertase subtilisin/kexin type 2